MDSNIYIICKFKFMHVKYGWSQILHKAAGWTALDGTDGVSEGGRLK